MAFPVCLACHQPRTHFTAQVMHLRTGWYIKHTASINSLHGDFYYRLNMPCIYLPSVSYKPNLLRNKFSIPDQLLLSM